MNFAAPIQYNPESVNSYVNPNSLLCGDTGQVASGSDEPASLMLVIVRSGSPSGHGGELGPSERDASQFLARRWDHSPAPALGVILFDRGDCRMSTWTEDDKQIAARALKTLEQARVASRGAAIYCLEPVRGEMASKRPDDIPERADAWLAVCSLCEALVEPDSEEPVSRWRDAINKTQAWLDAMR